MSNTVKHKKRKRFFLVNSSFTRVKTLLNAANHMGVSRRPQVAFICNKETKAFLEEWSKEERRTVSNLVESIVEDAIAEKKSERSDKEALALALDLISTMIEGKPPTLAQIAKLAHETDLDEDDLLKLQHLLSKGKATNGT